MRGRAVVVGGLVALSVLAVAACSDDGDEEPAPPTPTTSAPADIRFALRPVLQVAPCAAVGATTPVDGADDPAATVVLPGIGAPPAFCYELGPVPAEGPVLLAGAIIDDAEAVESAGEWVVAVGIVDDVEPALATVASACFERDPVVCPTGQLAIVLDGVVQSAPMVEQPAIDVAGIAISGDYTEAEARAVAAALDGD